MSVAFLHGVESLTLDSGPRPIKVVKSAVIGLIGIAPTGPINTPTLVYDDRRAAQFGKKVPGFNIPQALDAIFKQGAGNVVVINVFDATLHTSQVTQEAHTLVDGKTKLTYAPIGAVTVLNSDNSASSLVKDVDYSIDEYGNFARLKSTVSATLSLKFTYKKLNAAAITSSLLIGDVDSDGNRTGMQAWQQAKNLFGFNPKILIAPGYSSLNAITAELLVQAEKLRAIAVIDAPLGTSVDEAITGRGIESTINFQTGSKRAYLVYPALKAYDPATDTDTDQPYSQFMAGVMSASDDKNGYWVSPSNQDIKGIVGAERNITAALNDASTDANALNEVGITTIFNAFGTGIKTWGNRNASFPVNTGIDSFVSVLRTADVVAESVELAMGPYVDKPINQALIDTIREDANNFIRTLIGRGALIPGSRCEFPKDQNTAADIAAGHLTFDIIMCPPPPFERGTFRYYLDTTLLGNFA